MLQNVRRVLLTGWNKGARELDREGRQLKVCAWRVSRDGRVKNVASVRCTLDVFRVSTTLPPPMPALSAGNGDISIAAGIIIGLLASCVQSLGLTIQRKSHVLNQALPDHLQRVEHRRP